MRNLLRLLKIGVLTVARELLPARKLSLPRVPAAPVVVAVGLFVALVLPVDARPPALTSGLAIQRLERFLEQRTADRPELLPMGEIHTPRPAFHWPAVAGAARYDFTLAWDGGQIRSLGLSRPAYVMRPPGRLASGIEYRFEAAALDAAGRRIGRLVTGNFTVRAATRELQDLEAQARLELEPHDIALILAGYYAENGGTADVVAALEAYLRTGAQGEGAAVAHRILERLGYR